MSTSGVGASSFHIDRYSCYNIDYAREYKVQQLFKKVSNYALYLINKIYKRFYHSTDIILNKWVAEDKSLTKQRKNIAQRISQYASEARKYSSNGPPAFSLTRAQIKTLPDEIFSMPEFAEVNAPDHVVRTDLPYVERFSYHSIDFTQGFLLVPLAKKVSNLFIKIVNKIYGWIYHPTDIILNKWVKEKLVEERKKIAPYVSQFAHEMRKYRAPHGILDLSSLQIDSLPRSVFSAPEFSKVTLLNISHNNLKEVPEAIYDLKQLSTLDLGSNKLTRLPDCLGQFSQLKYLHLNHNQFSELPPCVGRIHTLVSLVIGFNHLTSLSPCIGNLQKLEQLDVGHNCLKEIPDELENLTELRSFVAPNNQLTEFPESLLERLSLVNLNLNHNQIGEIPQEIQNLQNLVFLHMQNNNLFDLSNSINSLRALRYLYIQNNHLINLPAWAKQKKDLIVFHSGNPCV